MSILLSSCSAPHKTSDLICNSWSMSSSASLGKHLVGNEAMLTKSFELKR
jgi:hypothetical protein